MSVYTFISCTCFSTSRCHEVVRMFPRMMSLSDPSCYIMVYYATLCNCCCCCFCFYFFSDFGIYNQSSLLSSSISSGTSISSFSKSWRPFFFFSLLHHHTTPLTSLSFIAIAIAVIVFVSSLLHYRRSVGASLSIFPLAGYHRIVSYGWKGGRERLARVEHDPSWGN